MFFNDWHALLRVVVTGALAYLALVLFLRISGKRTLSKMNAFDLVVTVAFGSTLATTILSREVALAEGLVALALLVILQFIMTWSSARWSWFHRLVKAEPTMIAFRGEPLHDVMLRERVTPVELDAALREAGLHGVDAAFAVVLETEGALTVVPYRDDEGLYPSLEHVEGVPDHVHGKRK